MLSTQWRTPANRPENFLRFHALLGGVRIVLRASLNPHPTPLMSNPKLAVGDLAPAFSLPSDDGQTVSLEGLRGSFVILYFYPRDNTPGCTTQACDFRDALPSLANDNTVVIGVSGDSLKSHAKFRDKHALNFPLLADDSTEMMDAYGVWREKSMYGKTSMGVVRSTFLISPDGVILELWDKVRVHIKKKDGSVTRHVDTVRAALEQHLG